MPVLRSICHSAGQILQVHVYSHFLGKNISVLYAVCEIHRLLPRSLADFLQVVTVGIATLDELQLHSRSIGVERLIVKLLVYVFGMLDRCKALS